MLTQNSKTDGLSKKKNNAKCTCELKQTNKKS